MRRDTRPYVIRRLLNQLNRWYTERFIRPQFDSLGCELRVASPRHLIVFGRDIHAGDHTHIICAPDNKVRLTTWRSRREQGTIRFGHHCLISPGVRISAADSVTIGDNCMLAAKVTISDSDWHGLYNRIRPFRCTRPVTLHDNVWLGDGVIVTKGVTIGENSVIGAGAVVTCDIPANTVAAGNPARVVKQLNPKRRMLTRAWLFDEARQYHVTQDQIDRYALADNSWLNWLRSCIKPTRED